MVREIQSTASRASLLTEQLQAIGAPRRQNRWCSAPGASSRSASAVRIVGVDVKIAWSLDSSTNNVRVDAIGSNR